MDKIPTPQLSPKENLPDTFFRLYKSVLFVLKDPRFSLKDRILYSTFIGIFLLVFGSIVLLILSILLNLYSLKVLASIVALFSMFILALSVPFRRNFFRKFTKPFYKEYFGEAYAEQKEVETFLWVKTFLGEVLIFDIKYVLKILLFGSIPGVLGYTLLIFTNQNLFLIIGLALSGVIFAFGGVNLHLLVNKKLLWEKKSASDAFIFTFIFATSITALLGFALASFIFSGYILLQSPKIPLILRVILDKL